MFDSCSVNSGSKRIPVASPAASPPDQEQHPCPNGAGRPGWGRIGAFLALFAALFVSTGCGDDLFEPRWFSNPEEATIYSLAIPELNLPTVFNFVQRTALRIESAQAVGRWDLALDTQDGGLVFLPPGALDVQSRARITVLPDTTFDEVRVAPADSTLYSAEEPVPVALGNVYVVRTRQVTGSFGRPCVYYAKLEPLSMDVEAGRLTFLFDSSPVCNDRRLVPPND